MRCLYYYIVKIIKKYIEVKKKVYSIAGNFWNISVLRKYITFNFNILFTLFQVLLYIIFFYRIYEKDPKKDDTHS